MIKLIKEFEVARKDFTEILSKFPKERVDEKLFGKWNLKELIVHLTGWANHQSEYLSYLKNGTAKEKPEDLKNSINERFVESLNAFSWDEIHNEFIRATEKLIFLYRELKEDEWSKPIYKGLKTTPEDFIKIEIHHYSHTHGPQVKEVLKLLGK